MKATKLDERFFDSTRGRIVALLRGTTKTVNELVEEIELTDNAVRAHLLTLERDGIVRQSGVQRGFRKPHYAYELTPEAENLFPKAYDALLNQLITVLKARLTAKALEKVLREVGNSIAARQTSNQDDSDLESRLQKALHVLGTLGGAAQIEKEGGTFYIRSAACPFAATVTEHPEVCRLAETLVAEIVGERVQEQCNKGKPPQCRFEIACAE